MPNQSSKGYHDSNSLQGLIDAISSFGQTTGDYWSKSNADFAATNPTLTDKIIRGVNPMTGFGSALGQMADAASQGDKLAMALSAFGAMPAFGAAGKVANPMAEIVTKSLGQKVLESAAARTARNLANNTATSLITDDIEQERQK